MPKSSTIKINAYEESHMDGPILDFVQADDGRIHRLSPWFPLVRFPLQFLQSAPASLVAYRGDDVILRCTTGGARYVLSACEDAESRVGRLVESWCDSL